MDRIYRRQRHIYDLTRRYYLFGRDRLIAGLAPGQGTVLEIGCGTGRNLAAMARRYPQARLFGLDVSAAMLATAAATLKRHDLERRVRITQADATAFDATAAFGTGTFDRVVFSYTLSMIPDWRAALDQAARCVAPGGRLEIVDFGLLEAYPALARRALFAWLRAFHVHPIAALPQALTELAVREGFSLQVDRLFGGYATSARLARPPGASAGLTGLAAAAQDCPR